MATEENVRYALATFRTNSQIHVGLVSGDKIVDVNQALREIRMASGYKRAEGIAFSSMLDVLQQWQEISPLIDEVGPDSDDLLARSRSAVDIKDIVLLAPVPNPGKIINVGLNFYDHAREMGILDLPPDFQPNFFYKGDLNAVIGPSQNIRIAGRHIDWEAELAVVIGKTAKDIKPEDAMDYIAGYTCHNDITDRGSMMKADGSLDFFSGKVRDTFAALGPFLIPRHFVPNPKNLRIRCLLNGEIMQDFGTDQMIWGPAECIAYASSRITLQPGDIIGLGTGAGTGWTKGITVGPGEMGKLVEHMFSGGGRFLRNGDRITVEIDSIGTLENGVQAS